MMKTFTPILPLQVSSIPDFLPVFVTLWSEMGVSARAYSFSTLLGSKCAGSKVQQPVDSSTSQRLAGHPMAQHGFSMQVNTVRYV